MNRDNGVIEPVVRARVHELIERDNGENELIKGDSWGSELSERDNVLKVKERDHGTKCLIKRDSRVKGLIKRDNPSQGTDSRGTSCKKSG